jgi:hypothetical protein
MNLSDAVPTITTGKGHFAWFPTLFGSTPILR